MTTERRPFMRDMDRFRTTAARLKAWRTQYPGESIFVGKHVGPGAHWFGEVDGLYIYADPTTGRKSCTYGTANRPFRFVGYADECKGGPDHTGWFAAPADDDYRLCRGTVFRIPGRDGAERYMIGAEFGDNMRKGFDADCCGFIDIEGRGNIYDTEEEAARAADQFAEGHAEREREYQESENARIREEERRHDELEDFRHTVEVV